jgi:hypothetical protein
LLNLYFVKGKSEDENFPSNSKLGFTKAHHIIFGYDFQINSNLRVKIEPYYQYLYDVPVIKDSSFSLINLELANEFNEKLINKGSGTNIGIDFTVERFLKDGFYYLLTASVFNSTFKGGDGITRNTRYNKNFMANLLGGKEWEIRKNGKNNVLGINARLYIKGGDRTSPVDMSASTIAEKVVFDERKAFENQRPVTYRCDLGMTYRKNKPKYSSVWSIQLLNATYSPIMYEFKYNANKKKVEEVKQRFAMPAISWKIEF